MALEAPPPEALPAVAATSHRAGGAISIALLIVSVCFAIAGQLTLKTAMDQIGRIGSAQVTAAGSTIVKAIKTPRLWIGLSLFGISALFWLVVLSRVPLSLAYPMVGISYILIVAFARLFLGESVPPLRWVGVAIVAAGIAIVGSTFDHP